MKLFRRRVLSGLAAGSMGTVAGCSQIGLWSSESCTLGVFNSTQERQTVDLVVQPPEGATVEGTVTVESVTDTAGSEIPNRIPDVEIPKASGTYSIRARVDDQREELTLEEGSYEWDQSYEWDRSGDDSDDVDHFVEVYLRPGRRDVDDLELSIRDVRTS